MHYVVDKCLNMTIYFFNFFVINIFILNGKLNLKLIISLVSKTLNFYLVDKSVDYNRD